MNHNNRIILKLNLRLAWYKQLYTNPTLSRETVVAVAGSCGNSAEKFRLVWDLAPDVKPCPEIFPDLLPCSSGNLCSIRTSQHQRQLPWVFFWHFYYTSLHMYHYLYTALRGICHNIVKQSYSFINQPKTGAVCTKVARSQHYQTCSEKHKQGIHKMMRIRHFYRRASRSRG
jgi:hypothetical protein